MSSFKGKTFAITGASGGMGTATAQLLASRGASLSLCDIDAHRMATLKTSLGEPSADQKWSFHVVDVTNSELVDAWIEQTVKVHGEIHGAANLAGISGLDNGFKPLTETTDEDWHTIMGVNTNGSFFPLRAELRAMQGKTKGSIVMCSSVSALRVQQSPAPYATSKHAIIGLTKYAAAENGPYGIRVNCIAPGVTDTPLVAKLHLNEEQLKGIADASFMKRRGTPEDVAEFVAYLLSDASSFITGSVLPIDGGLGA